MNFKPGDSVICTVHGVWMSTDKVFFGLFKRRTKMAGPKLNEVVTVELVGSDDFTGWITLKEYHTTQIRPWFRAKYFQLLLSDAELAAELASCREPNFT